MYAVPLITISISGISLNGSVATLCSASSLSGTLLLAICFFIRRLFHLGRPHGSWRLNTWRGLRVLPGLRLHLKLYLRLIRLFLIRRAMFIRRNMRRCLYVLFMAETIRGHRERLISSLAFRAALPLPTLYCCRLSVDVVCCCCRRGFYVAAAATAAIITATNADAAAAIGLFLLPPLPSCRLLALCRTLYTQLCFTD